MRGVLLLANGQKFYGQMLTDEAAVGEVVFNTGMPDAIVAGFAGATEEEVKTFREKLDIRPTFKMVDTCAAEFEAATPYYYSCYATEDEVKPLGDKSVIVLGSGPIRIGQGIEFDYCSVHSAWALRKAGMPASIVLSSSWRQ